MVLAGCQGKQLLGSAVSRHTLAHDCETAVGTASFCQRDLTHLVSAGPLHVTSCDRVIWQAGTSICQRQWIIFSRKRTASELGDNDG